MKKIMFGVIACVLLCSYMAINSVIEQLGIADASAKNYILKNIIGRHDIGAIDDAEQMEDGSAIYKELKAFKLPVLKNLTAVMAGNKKLIAKEACSYVKAYVESEEFKAAYAKARAEAKPTSEPDRLDATTIEMLKKTLKEGEKNYASLKGNKMVPATALAQMQKSITDMKAQIASESDPTPNKTRWLLLYPENPNVAVKNKLQEYLKLAPTVDFSATLTGAGKNKKFASPAYEAKSLKWKAIYKIGKEANEVTTAFVKEWIKQYP